MSARVQEIHKQAKEVDAASSEPRFTKGPKGFSRRNEAARESRRGASPRTWRSIGFALVDVLFVCGSALLAYRIRFSFNLRTGWVFLEHPFRQSSGIAGTYLGFLSLYVILIVLLALSQKLYRITPGFSPLFESLYIGRAVMVASVILTGFIYLSGIKTVSRLVVGLTALLSLATLCTWRLFQGYLERQRLAKKVGLRHVVIVGAGKVGTMLVKYLEQNPQLGYDVRGFLDSNHHEDPRILGKVEDLPRIARQEFVDEIFVTLPSERDLVKAIAVEAMQAGIGVKVIPELYDGLAWQCQFEFIGDIPVRVLHREPIPDFWLFLKRATDIVGSSVGLVLLFPILLLIALVIKVDSKGTILYRANRVGKKGRKFLCYKFRTMIPDADERKDELRSRNERLGPFFKISNDPRTTRIGSFLRRYSLDELPQLWNVLKGDMSLVGPRPHPVDDFKSYSLEHFRRLNVTPGITCLWQLDARHDPSFEKVLALDSQYIETWSYLLDLRILWRTIPAVIKGSGH
jgi:exopolysaccharide biosynthesis polyprenyl glycosylphosphotransferase